MERMGRRECRKVNRTRRCVVEEDQTGLERTKIVNFRTQDRWKSQGPFDLSTSRIVPTSTSDQRDVPCKKRFHEDTE